MELKPISPPEHFLYVKEEAMWDTLDKIEWVAEDLGMENAIVKWRAYCAICSGGIFIQNTVLGKQPVWIGKRVVAMQRTEGERRDCWMDAHFMEEG